VRARQAYVTDVTENRRSSPFFKSYHAN